MFMEARYFRYQYENTEDGIIQSGCVWSDAIGNKTTYLYMAGEYSQIPKTKRRREGGLNIIPQESALDLFVLGAYTVPYIRRLTEILKERKIRKVVLPYVPPTIRWDIITYLTDKGECTEEVQCFLSAPYAYLKGKGVGQVFLLYGNGPTFHGEVGDLEEGNYFERVDDQLQAMITDMEKAPIPVYYAGFIVENQWFYYFGFYSVDMLWNGSRNSFDTITMFSGPVFIKNEEVHCLFSSKVFTREQHCNCNIDAKDQYENCALKCLYRNDYDRIKKHMDANHDVLRVGLLNLGNVNLNTSLKSVIARYGAVLQQVRGIAIPNCGDKKSWSKKLLSVFTGLDMEYYICACGKNTDNGVIRDIVTSSSFNRFINVNEEFAYCFSGFIAPKDEN